MAHFVTISTEQLISTGLVTRFTVSKLGDPSKFHRAIVDVARNSRSVRWSTVPSVNGEAVALDRDGSGGSGEEGPKGEIIVWGITDALNFKFAPSVTGTRVEVSVRYEGAQP